MASPHATKEERREVMPGYPIEVPFKTPEEVWGYLRGERIQCLRCGKWYKGLNSHLLAIHGMDTREYKVFYGLPVSAGHSGLVCGETHEILSEHSKRRAVTRRDELLALIEQYRPLAAKRAKGSHRAAYRDKLLVNLGKYATQGPDGYPDSVWDEFLLRIAGERTDFEVSRDDDMPGRTAFFAKMKEDPDFSKRFKEVWSGLPFSVQVRARRLSADFGKSARVLAEGGMTQKAIAVELGVTQMTVCRHIAETKAMELREGEDV